MAITEKPLAQLRPISTGAEVLYSPPVGITTIVKSLVITPTGNTATAYSLWMDIDGATANDQSILAEDMPLNWPEMIILDVYWPMVEDSTLLCKNPVGSTVNFTVFGAEIT